MSYEIQTTSSFDKECKKMVKEYFSIKKEYSDFTESLASKPVQGTNLGNNAYKIRLAIASKNKGKSGGSRVISVVIYSNKEAVLISIYDKSNKDSISDKELFELLKQW